MDCSLKETFVVIIKRRDIQFPSLKWSDHKPTEKHDPNISSSHKFLVVKGNYKWESGLNSTVNNSRLIFVPRWAASLCLVHHLLLAIGTAHGGGEVNRNWICEPAQGKRCGGPSFVMGDSGSPTLVPPPPQWWDNSMIWRRKCNYWCKPWNRVTVMMVEGEGRGGWELDWTPRVWCVNKLYWPSLQFWAGRSV